MATYRRTYEVTCEAGSAQEAENIFDADGPEVGAGCNEAQSVGGLEVMDPDTEIFTEVGTDD